MANGHGGARPNSGRKKGVLNQRSSEISARAAEEGLLPLEIMLVLMREFYDEAVQLAHAEVINTNALREAQMRAYEAAKDAAPYCHPRLAQVKHDGETDNKLQIVLQREDADL